MHSLRFSHFVLQLTVSVTNIPWRLFSGSRSKQQGQRLIVNYTWRRAWWTDCPLLFASLTRLKINPESLSFKMDIEKKIFASFAIYCHIHSPCGFKAKNINCVCVCVSERDNQIVLRGQRSKNLQEFEIFDTIKAGYKLTGRGEKRDIASFNEVLICWQWFSL